MGLPQNMKPAQILGDSFAYREAYRNREIYITIVYGEMSPNRDERGLPFDGCDTPAWLLKESTYRESVINIDGRNAKLSIDRDPQSDIGVRLCFPPDEKGVQFILSADCRNERAVQTARQIFSSVRFKNR